MKKEDKELLLKDIFARLPYDLIVQETFQDAKGDRLVWNCGPHYIKGHPEKIKPYLRPMSSMTEEEKKEYLSECDKDNLDTLSAPHYHGTDWLNKKMFDYRGLIPMGIALKAPEEMYNF